MEVSLVGFLLGFDCEKAQMVLPGSPKQGAYSSRIAELYRGTMLHVGAAEFLEVVLNWWLMSAGSYDNL